MVSLIGIQDPTRCDCVGALGAGACHDITTQAERKSDLQRRQKYTREGETLLTLRREEQARGKELVLYLHLMLLLKDRKFRSERHCAILIFA